MLYSTNMDAIEGSVIGGKLQGIITWYEDLLTGPIFSVSRAVQSTLALPVLWSLHNSRTRAHLDMDTQTQWLGPALGKGMVLEGIDVGLEVLEKWVVVRMAQAIREATAPGEEEVPPEQRVGQVVTSAMIASGVKLSAWFARVFLRLYVLKLVTGRENLKAQWSPAFLLVLGRLFISVFPFGRLALLRTPALLTLTNALRETEVLQTVEAAVAEDGAEELVTGPILCMERAIDGPRGWGVFVAGMYQTVIRHYLKVYLRKQ